MLNTLIISSQLKFVQKLTNSLDIEDLGICIVGIADKLYQINNILYHTRIDIIILDKHTELCFSNLFWKRYSLKTVLLSIGDFYSKNIEAVAQKISNLAIDANLDRKKNKSDLILDELKYLGYKIKYKGTLLLLAAISEVFKHPQEGFDNFENRIFTVIAKTYHSSFSNVKSAINNATNYMYRDCDIEKLKKYFSLSEDVKPGVKDVAIEVYNKVKAKLL